MMQEVLERIKPVAKEEERVKKFISDILRVAKTVSGYDCVIVGSLGKGTWLSGDHDIDLFIVFPPAVGREVLEKKGLEFGQQIAKEMKGSWTVKYAEHPYTHAVIRGFDVDVVPCFRIARGEKIISAVDRSPLHLEYVIENMTPVMKDEVRLLKQFCKGMGVYGSDAKNMGFSGYICELLVMRYGSFESVMKSAASWEIPHVVDLEVQREHVDREFHDQSLIVIDPTDPSRNAAANLGARNLILFIAAAKRFLEKPSKDFFFPKAKKPLSSAEISMIRKRQGEFFALVMKRPVVVDDVLYPQLRKALYRIESHLKYNEFLALRSIEHAGKSIALIFEMENWVLPRAKKMVGPPIFSHRHSMEFLEKYGSVKPPEGFGPYVEDNRWIADKKREFNSADEVLTDLQKKKPQELAEMGVPRYIADCLKSARLVRGNTFFTLLRKDPEISASLRQAYFEKLSI